MDVQGRSTESGPRQNVNDDEVVTITDLFMRKVRETPNATFLRYTATDKGKSDYIGATLSDIDRLVDEAARQYLKRGLHPEVRSCVPRHIVIYLN